MKNRLYTLSVNTARFRFLNDLFVVLFEKYLRQARQYPQVLLTLLILFGLSACGGGGGDGEQPKPGQSATPKPSEPTPSDQPQPSTSPIPSGNKTTLLVTVKNLQGQYTLQWKTQLLKLNPEKASGSLGSDDTKRTEYLDISHSGPQFQRCSDYSFSADETEATLLVTCKAPDAHYLQVTTTGLRSSLTVNWSGKTAQLNSENPSQILTATTADFAPPSFEQPAHQDCQAELLNAHKNTADYSIQCQDKVAKVRVIPSGLLPIGLSLKVGDQTLAISDNSIVFDKDVSRFIQPAINSELEANTRCDITPKGYDSASNEMQWQLACHSFALFERPKQGEMPAGVYIQPDNGEAQLLAENQSVLGRPVGIFAAGSDTVVFNHLFGARQLHKTGDGVYSWSTIDRLPQSDGLHAVYEDVWLSSEALYLLFKAESGMHSVYRVDKQLNVRLIASNTEGYDKAFLMPISYHRDEIAVEQRKTVVAGDDESLINVYRQANSVADWQRQGDRTNIGQAFPYGEVYGFFTENKTHADTNKRTDFNLVSLDVANQENPDPVLGQYDTNISVATWQHGEQIRTWFVGDGIAPDSSKLNQVAELTERDGQMRITEVEDFADHSISAISSSANLTVLMKDMPAHDNYIAAMYTERGRVDLTQLTAALEVGTPLRTKFLSFTLGGNWSTGFERQAIGFANGWLLVYSGSDEQGSVWLTNGHAEDSHIISRNTTLSKYYQYQLAFASKAIAVVVDSDTKEAIIVKRE